MAFSVALFVTGIALLILGLVGRVTVHEIHAGTESKILRIIIAFIGLACIGGGIFAEGLIRASRPDPVISATSSAAGGEPSDDSTPPSQHAPPVSKITISPGPIPKIPEEQPELVRPADSPQREHGAGLLQSEEQPELVPPADREAVPNKYPLAAVIDDSDGYTNLRSSPSTQGQIIRQIRENESFYTFIQQSSWWHVKTSDGKFGYIDSSRIKILAK